MLCVQPGWLIKHMQLQKEWEGDGAGRKETRKCLERLGMERLQQYLKAVDWIESSDAMRSGSAG